jgi:hypothetical protein
MVGVEYQTPLLDYGVGYHFFCGDPKLPSPSEGSQPIPGSDVLIVRSAIRGSTTEQACKDIAEHNIRIHGVHKLPSETSSLSPLQHLLLLQTTFTCSVIQDFVDSEHLATLAFVNVSQLADPFPRLSIRPKGVLPLSLTVSQNNTADMPAVSHLTLHELQLSNSDNGNAFRRNETEGNCLDIPYSAELTSRM